jgi:ferredoxin--NADP+ reductase
MLEDLPSLPDADRPDIEALLRKRGVAWVSFDAWRVLDRVELERGSQRGKVRDKLSMLDDMLAAIEANRE